MYQEEKEIQRQQPKPRPGRRRGISNSLQEDAVVFVVVLEDDSVFLLLLLPVPDLLLSVYLLPVYILFSLTFLGDFDDFSLLHSLQMRQTVPLLCSTSALSLLHSRRVS